MNTSQGGLIVGAGLLAGMVNSMAGGGSFLTLPALVACGLPPVLANTTSSVALWPGTVAGFGAYRRELAARRQLAVVLALVSLVGGLAGGWILLNTKPITFSRLLPWLTLFATLLFTFGRPLSERLRLSLGTEHDSGALYRTAFIQLIVAVYCGYYGAGASIMMLSMLALLGMRNIHAMNALKMLLAAASNLSAVVLFIVLGRVAWPEAFLMMAGAVVGGYGGAWLAQRLPAGLVRGFVIVMGVVTTVYFFSPSVQNHPRKSDQSRGPKTSAPTTAAARLTSSTPAAARSFARPTNG